MTNIGRHRLRNALSPKPLNSAIRLRYFAAAPEPAAAYCLTQVTCSRSAISAMLGLDTDCPSRDEGDPAMADTVLYEVSDGLATITLNRPDAMNALNTEAKVALRDALRRRPPPTPPYGPCCSPRPGAPSASARTSRSTSALLAADREARHRRHHDHRARSTTTRSCAAHHRDAEAGRGRGQRRRRGRGRGFALAADYRVVADTASFNTSFAGVALTADSGRLLDAAPADRPRAAPPTCCSSRARSRAQEALRAGHREQGGPRRRAGRRGRGGGPRAGRGPDGRVRGDQGVPGLRRRRTRSPRPWRRRTSSRRGRARRRTTRSRSQAFVEEGEAEVPAAAEPARLDAGATGSPAGRSRGGRGAAVGQVVVDQAAGLHQGVGRGGADEAEAALLEVLGQRRGLRR